MSANAAARAQPALISRLLTAALVGVKNSRVSLQADAKQDASTLDVVVFVKNVNDLLPVASSKESFSKMYLSFGANFYDLSVIVEIPFS